MTTCFKSIAGLKLPSKVKPDYTKTDILKLRADATTCYYDIENQLKLSLGRRKTVSESNPLCGSARPTSAFVSERHAWIL